MLINSLVQYLFPSRMEGEGEKGGWCPVFPWPLANVSTTHALVRWYSDSVVYCLENEFLLWARSITMEQIYPGNEAWREERC